MPQKALKQLEDSDSSDSYVVDKNNIIEDYKRLNDQIDSELEKISERKSKRLKK